MKFEDKIKIEIKDVVVLISVLSDYTRIVLQNKSNEDYKRINNITINLRLKLLKFEARELYKNKELYCNKLEEIKELESQLR